MVHTAVVKKLNDFPRTEPKDNDKLFHISDILREIESLKADEWLSDVVCVGESQAEPEDLLQKEIDQNLNL